MTARISRDFNAWSFLPPLAIALLVFMALLGVMSGIQRTNPEAVLIPAALTVPLWVAWRAFRHQLADLVDIEPADLVVRYHGREIRVGWGQVAEVQAHRSWKGERVRIRLRSATDIADAFEFTPQDSAKDVCSRLRNQVLGAAIKAPSR